MKADTTSKTAPRDAKRSIFDDPYDPPGWSAGRSFAPAVRPQSPIAARGGDLPVMDRFLARFRPD